MPPTSPACFALVLAAAPPAAEGGSTLEPEASSLSTVDALATKIEAAEAQAPEAKSPRNESPVGGEMRGAAARGLLLRPAFDYLVEEVERRSPRASRVRRPGPYPELRRRVQSDRDPRPEPRPVLQRFDRHRRASHDDAPV